MLALSLMNVVASEEDVVWASAPTPQIQVAWSLQKENDFPVISEHMGLLREEARMITLCDFLSLYTSHDVGSEHAACLHDPPFMMLLYDEIVGLKLSSVLQRVLRQNLLPPAVRLRLHAQQVC